MANLGTIASSGNIPNIYNPICWFDCSDTSASNITHSSGLVSLLKDRSGTGNDGIQATGAARPTTNSSTINGLNAIDFGIGDYLGMANVATAANLTILGVFKPIGNNNGAASFLSADAADHDFQIDSVTSGQYLGRVNSTNLGATTAPNLGTNKMGSVLLSTYRFSANDGNVKVRLNGSEVGSDTYNGSMSSTLTIRIAINRALNTSLKLYLGELIIFNSDLSADKIDIIESYLINKWGVV